MEREEYLILLTRIWSDIYRADSFNDKFASFMNILSFHYNNAFPYQRIRLNNNNRQSWINGNIRMSSVLLQDLYVLQ